MRQEHAERAEEAEEEAALVLARVLVLVLRVWVEQRQE